MTTQQRVRILRRALAELEAGHPNRARELVEQLLRDLDPPAPPGVPALGPVLAGARSILLEQLTHPTGGLDHYPAFDFGFGQPGARIVAPERLEVTKHGRAVRRDGRPNGRIVYATGNSRLKYAFVHVEQPAAIGARIAKGGRVAEISANHEVPHGHLGIDARELLGHELERCPQRYVRCGPTIGEQLRRAAT